MATNYVLNENPTQTVAPATLELKADTPGAIAAIDIHDHASVIFINRGRGPGQTLTVLSHERTLASITDDELDLVSRDYRIPREQLVELRALEIEYRKCVAAQTSD